MNILTDNQTINTGLAGISIFFAFLSYRIARKATKDSYRHQKLTAKFHEMSIQYQALALQYQELASQKNLFEISRHHQQTLHEVTDELRIIMRELMTTASKTRNKIYYHFNDYDHHSAERSLRHCFGDINKIVMATFDKQLDRQSGQYLIDQLSKLTRIEEDIQRPSSKETLWDKLVFFFKDKPKPAYTKDILYANPLFYKSIKTILDAFTVDQSRKFYSETYPYIEEYLEVHNKFKKQLESLESRLSKAQEENRREPFEIKQIPNFGVFFIRTKADITRMIHLCPRFIPTPEGQLPPPNCLSNIIFAGTILYIVAHPQLWGQTQQNWTHKWRPYT